MKALVTFLLSIVTFNVHGQLTFHADTACITDPYLILIRNEIERQRAWFIDLASSPKTLERLKREYSHVYNLPVKYKERYKPQELYSTVLLTKEMNALAEYEFQERICRLVTGKYNIFYEKYSLGSVLDLYYDTARFNMGLYMQVNSLEVVRPYAEKSQDSCESIKVEVLDSIPDPGDIMFRSLFYNKFKVSMFTTPIHEFSHQSTDGIYFLYPETMKILREITHFDGWNFMSRGVTKLKYPEIVFVYLDNPTEIKARLDALRYLLYREGICDLRVEDFRMKHLKLLRENLSIKMDTNVSELIFQILMNEKDLIWIMNNFA